MFFSQRTQLCFNSNPHTQLKTNLRCKLQKKATLNRSRWINMTSKCPKIWRKKKEFSGFNRVIFPRVRVFAQNHETN